MGQQQSCQNREGVVPASCEGVSGHRSKLYHVGTCSRPFRLFSAARPSARLLSAELLAQTGKQPAE